MNIFESILLGVVQGLTEFLPVSSSGHLELGKILFDIQIEENLLFSIVVHLGTALATIIVFRKMIYNLIKSSIKYTIHKGNVSEKDMRNSKLSLYLIISAVPVLVVYLLFNDAIEELFSGDLLLIGFALLVTSAFLVSTVVLSKVERQGKINTTNSVVIGISQAIAVIPGISRSGSTISTALVLGINKVEAAKFSFLMVLLPILGANTLEIYDAYKAGISTESAEILIAGFIAAFISGYIAIKFMLEIIRRSKLHYFALYTFVVGVIAIILSL
jgi:undecaprenyl-diphosphatase